MTGNPELENLRRKNHALVQNLANLGLRFEISLRMLSAISRLTTVPIQAGDLNEAAALTLNILIQEMVDIESCSIMIYRADEGRLKLLAARGQADFLEITGQTYNRELSFAPGEGFAGRVFVENRAHFWDQGSDSPEDLKRDPQMSTPVSMACLPLALSGNPLGVINISFGSPRPFDQPRKRDLTLLGEVVTNVMHTFTLKSELDATAEDLRHKIVQLETEIAERKRAEEKATTALYEKDVLLRELHHRVKNNMQVISSLIRLQARKIRHPEALKVFQESQDRIMAMALTHEVLYQSENVARLDLNKYVEKLVKSLFQAYAAGEAHIELEIDSEDITIAIDQAIPCGLIVNELVSNALRHAFPKGNGMVTVRARTLEDGQIELIIGDNGVGMPQDIDYRKTDTLGLRIVTDLVEVQFGGIVELAIDNGTWFRIRFPAATYQERL
jgi:two-component sensor histidine kinase